MKNFYCIVGLAAISILSPIKTNASDIKAEKKLVCNHKFGKIANGMGRLFKTPAMKGIAKDGIIDNPVGEREVYSRSSVSVVPIGGTPMETEDYGFAGVLVFGENGEVYLKNPFSQFVTGTYIEGVTETSTKNDSPDILTFELPQLVSVYEDDGDYYDLYACMLSFSEDGEELETSESQQLEFRLIDGSWVMSDPEAILGLTFDDASWTGFAEMQMTYSPITDKTAEVPDNLAYEKWMITYGNEGHYVDVAIDGENCYVKNFLPTSEDTLVPMVGKWSDEGMSFTSPQYLGVNEDTSYLTYFYGGGIERVELEDAILTSFVPVEEMQFRLTDDGAYASDETALFTPFKDIKSEYFWFESIFEAPTLKKSETIDFVPANPSVVDYRYYPSFDFGYVSFEIPMLNNDGMILNTDNLYYNVYLDGEILEFDNDEYHLFEEKMIDIPYNFEDGVNGSGDIKLEGSKHTIMLFREGLEELGIQSFYVDESGTRYYSDLITSFISGVESISTDKEISGIKYYDLTGREISNPVNGIYLRTLHFSDGTLLTHKVRK
ncbi:MAG: hypothetical protein HDR88_05470 [Bacteroides sp.]|nr:hypothetical protein [Bacteroides sp.]